MRSNENKMSDGGRDRLSLGVNLWKSSQKSSVQRSAVRSIAWLDLLVALVNKCIKLLLHLLQHCALVIDILAEEQDKCVS
jgi:hypothetical protein